MYCQLEKLRSTFKVQQFVIDNCAFRLHYKITTPLLLVFSILLTCEKIVENPIQCMRTDNIPISLLNSFCWVHSTFSVPESWNKKVGEEIPYPGVDKYIPGKERVYHAYYQWVGLALFFQSLLFYIPHYAWKTMEGHKIKYLTEDLLNPKENNKETVDGLVNYLVDSRKQHYWYYAGYFFTEILNLLNVAAQTFLMDKFLHGEFSALGKTVAESKQWNSSIAFDPLVKVFPRVTKCTFHQYGPSGTVQRHESLCVLPLNIYYEKIYVVLWFWLSALTLISAMVVLYRLLLSSFPSFRAFVFKLNLCFADRKKGRMLIETTGCGDWLVLDLLRRNLDPVRYRVIIEALSRRTKETGNCSV